MVNGWVDVYILMGAWMNWYLDAWIEKAEKVDGWMDGWMDG